MTRKTKIVCTVGPATNTPEKLAGLISAGMDVARLNFSHGTREEKVETIATIRNLSQRLRKPVAILQDLAGPKVRIRSFADGAVWLEPGRTFTLTARDITGSEEAVSLSYTGLPQDVCPGDTLLLSDGAIELQVEQTTATDIACRVIVGGSLADKKGINLPSRSVNVDFFSDKDQQDLSAGLEAGVDYVALSFVRSETDIAMVRAFMQDAGRQVPLLAKIEKHEALQNIDRILEVVDGIMIARGDLGVELPVERIPRIQKMLIRKTRQHGLPVITATQMLKSMVESPRPTRAEVTDVANAVLDGTDAVMLSEETAVGRFPEEAVRTMSRIAFDAEAAIDERKLTPVAQASAEQAVAEAAVELARDLKAAAILVCTQSGSTARLLTRCRPFTPVLAFTPDEKTCARMALLWGVVPLVFSPAGTSEEMEKQALEIAVAEGYVRPGQTVVLTAGLPLHVPGTTNTIRALTV